MTSVLGRFTPLSMHLVNTIFYNIPDATGNPLCLYAQGPIHTLGLRCTVGLASWSLGLMVLWLVAVVLAILALWKCKQGFGREPSSSEHQRCIRREFTRLMLLVSAGMTILGFTFSAASIPSSAVLARYLHCLLISLPAVMWPLWLGASKVGPVAGGRAKLTMAFSRGLLLLIFIVFLAGTVAAFLDVPSVRRVEQQREAMLLKLENMHIQHFYTDDYWTCYRMAFASHEKLTCAVIEADLRSSGANRNRYWPYVLQVQADPHVAYVLRRMIHTPHPLCGMRIWRMGITFASI